MKSIFLRVYLYNFSIVHNCLGTKNRLWQLSTNVPFSMFCFQLAADTEFSLPLLIQQTIYSVLDQNSDRTNPCWKFCALNPELTMILVNNLSLKRQKFAAKHRRSAILWRHALPACLAVRGSLVRSKLSASKNVYSSGSQQPEGVERQFKHRWIGLDLYYSNDTKRSL